MVEQEGVINGSVNAIRYMLSDIGTFVIGGICYFGMNLLSQICIGIFLLPLFMGYYVKCARSLLAGDTTLPKFLGDNQTGNMYVDGVVSLAIYFVYLIFAAVIAVVLMVPAVIAATPMSLVDPDSSLAMVMALFVLAVWFVLFVIAMVLLITLVLMCYAGMVAYADTGDIVKAINPVYTFGLLYGAKGAALRATGKLILSTVILFIPALFIITIPFISFGVQASSAYIITRFYQEATDRMAVPATPYVETPGPAYH